jgi:hypothetical protein
VLSFLTYVPHIFLCKENKIDQQVHPCWLIVTCTVAIIRSINKTMADVAGELLLCNKCGCLVAPKPYRRHYGNCKGTLHLQQINGLRPPIQYIQYETDDDMNEPCIEQHSDDDSSSMPYLPPESDEDNFCAALQPAEYHGYIFGDDPSAEEYLSEEDEESNCSTHASEFIVTKPDLDKLVNDAMAGLTMEQQSQQDAGTSSVVQLPGITVRDTVIMQVNNSSVGLPPSLVG